MKKIERRSGKDRRKVVDPRYLGVKSKRKIGKEPRRKAHHTATARYTHEVVERNE